MSVHFSILELTFSSTAERRGINNSPPPVIVEHLEVLADGLERVRASLFVHNLPLKIDSGYRCPALNEAVGGATDSAHMQGWAADFTCTTLGPPLQIVRWIASSAIKFDQLIQEGSWVHISFDPRMRREVLTAHFAGGHATYTAGA